MPLQGLCFQHGIRTLPDNHRDDVAGAGAGVSLCLQGFAKRPADVCQMLAPFPHVCQPAHDKQCPSDVYGGQSGGEDKCAHAVDEVFPYHLPAYDVSACGCCRLAERADKEVDVSGAAGLLGATESLSAAHAESMGLVHVEQHIAVPAFQFRQSGQVGLVAVHAEDAFGDDDDLAKGGVVKFTSLHNQPSLRQMLTADFPVGRAKMRFAYIWDAQQSHVNDIKTHTYSHVFMVGFVKELYLLKNKRKK